MPAPGVDDSPIQPPCASTIDLLIARPRPLPLMARRCASADRKNRVNSRVCSASAMPMPVSATDTTTSPGSARAVTVTVPPPGENFTALDSRFSITRSICAPSASIAGSFAGIDSRIARCGSAVDRIASQALSSTSASCTGPAGQDERARLDVGERQQVVDQGEQAPAVAVDDRDDAAVLVAEDAVDVLGQDLGVAPDAGQRRAQLVRHGRDELALEPVHLLQFGVRPGQQLGLALQRLLGPAAGGDVGDLVHDVAAGALADQRRRVLRPGDLALPARQPHLAAGPAAEDVIGLAGAAAALAVAAAAQQGEVLRQQRPVLRQDDLVQLLAAQVVEAPAGHREQRGVGLDHLAVGFGHRHADRRVVERGPEPPLVLAGLRLGLAPGVVEAALGQRVLDRRAEPGEPVLEQVVDRAAAQRLDAGVLAERRRSPR